MIRVSNEELAAIDRAAEESKLSRAGWVMDAVKRTIESAKELEATRERLVAGRLARTSNRSAPTPSRAKPEDVPCETIHKGDAAIREDADEIGTRVPATAPDQATTSPSIEELRAEIPEPSYPKNPDTCAHPFRNSKGFCPSCGDQR